MWIVLILIVLWLLGWGLFSALGFIVHVLLIVAVIVLLVWLITGRKPSL